MKFKNWLVQSLGVFTTILSLALIYLVLFKEGHLQTVSSSMLIEFGIIIILAVSTKFFWYTSVENSIRTSEDYLNKRSVVMKAIEDEVTDAQDFDIFVEIENDINYNRYVSNRCKHLTASNYRLSIGDRLHKLFYNKDNAYYMERYILKVQYKASKIHKLSGASIRSLTQSIDGLTDDRNYANNKKAHFLISGSVFSFVSMFLTAAVVFTNKENFDEMYAILKMAIYTANILFSILQAVLKARLTVSTEDLAYFNKIISILEKYSSYKVNTANSNKLEVNDGANKVDIHTSE